jgi:hypothetical protein
MNPDTQTDEVARLKEENQKLSEEVKARQKAEYELIEAKDTMKAQSGSLERAWERHRATETALTEKNNEVARLKEELNRAKELVMDAAKRGDQMAAHWKDRAEKAEALVKQIHHYAGIIEGFQTTTEK